MTSYFDDAERAVHEIFRNDPMISDEHYLEMVAEIEEPVVKMVLLNTGDREFPHDLREKILGIIATQAIYQNACLSIPEKARRYTLACKTSGMLSALHSAFHDLARRRVNTRFGYWTDSPRQNLVSRDDHDQELRG